MTQLSGAHAFRWFLRQFRTDSLDISHRTYFAHDGEIDEKHAIQIIVSKTITRSVFSEKKYNNYYRRRKQDTRTESEPIIL